MFTGERETAARFKPEELLVMEEALKAIKLLNPQIFKRPYKLGFNAEEFVKRVLEGQARVAEVENGNEEEASFSRPM